MRRFATLSAAVLAAGCAPLPGSAAAPERPATPFAAAPSQPSAKPAPAPAASAAANPTPAATNEPIAVDARDVSPGTLVDLPVAGHAPAVVAIPKEGRRPVVVATHGAGGTPEAYCAYWRELVADAAFVLCPRGVTMDVYAAPEARGWFYPTHPALEREVRDALAALEARFGDRVDLDRSIYAGFSQGGVMGALAFSRAPAPFTALVLVEGGSEEWAMYSARAFARGGGRRVIFACGRRTCADPARKSATYLQRAGVAVRLVDKSGAGHTPGGAVREGLVDALPWLLEGDGRYAVTAR